MAAGLDQTRRNIIEFEQKALELNKLMLEIRTMRNASNLLEAQVIVGFTTKLLLGEEPILSAIQVSLTACQTQLEICHGKKKKLLPQVWAIKSDLDQELAKDMPTVSLQKIAEIEEIVRSGSAAAAGEECSEEEELKKVKEALANILSAMHFREDKLMELAKRFKASDLIEEELAKTAECQTFYDILKIIYPSQMAMFEQGGLSGGVRHPMQPSLNSVMQDKIRELKEGRELAGELNTPLNRHIIVELDMFFAHISIARSLKFIIGSPEKNKEDIDNVYQSQTLDLSEMILKSSFANYFLLRLVEQLNHKLETKIQSLNGLEERSYHYMSQDFQNRLDYRNHSADYDEGQKQAKQTQFAALKSELERLAQEKAGLLKEIEQLFAQINAQLLKMQVKFDNIRDMMGEHRSHHTSFATSPTSLIGGSGAASSSQLPNPAQ